MATCSNKAKASHNEGRAFENEPCRLFQLTLHTVFQEVFFNSVVTLMSVSAGLPYMGMARHASSCTQCCACLFPHSAQSPVLCSLLYGLQQVVPDGSNKVFFWGANEDVTISKLS